MTQQQNQALMDVFKETLGIGQAPANAAATVDAAAQGEVVGTVNFSPHRLGSEICPNLFS